MPRNRFKIDLNDDEGNKFTISLEGNLNRDKVLKILDFVYLLGGAQALEKSEDPSSYSKFQKVQNVIERKFPVGWFTSQEVILSYEDTYNEPISLSTVSTYLSRLAVKKVLIKSGPVNKRKFSLKKINERKKLGYISP